MKAGETIACPPELPFGTRVYIEGLGEIAGYGDERVCADRGGRIKGARIDVYMPDVKAARQIR